MGNFITKKGSLTNIAYTATRNYNGVAHRLKHSMFISGVGSSLLMALTNRTDTKETYIIKGGILITFIGTAILDHMRCKRIDNAIDTMEGVFKLIKRPFVDEILNIETLNDENTIGATITFDDKTYIKESICEGVYACTYTDKDKRVINITEGVKKLIKK